MIPGRYIAPLARAWSKWAKWLLDRTDLLDRWATNVDQVSLALALADEQIETASLSPRWNLPTHLEELLPTFVERPSVIHYHSRVDRIGMVEPVGIPAADAQIARANAAIRELWQSGFPNQTFWNWRYATNPELGSGVGSRGASLDSKRRMLKSAVAALKPGSVLDVGCGDGEATRGLSLPSYTGVDLSSESIARASAGRPDGTYFVGSLVGRGLKADLVICLDVLIHQPDATVYGQLVSELVDATQDALLVSGYERRPTAESPMIFFHEPLSATLTRLAPDAEIYPLGEVHEMTKFLLLKPPAARHPRDYTQASSHDLLRRHPNPLRLAAMRRSAQRTVGFYPVHEPRLWEYPGVVDWIERLGSAGARVVDIGAGVSPMAPYLTEHGFVVDTVDPSSMRREWPVRPDWDEWGYLDYAARGHAAFSGNCTLEQLTPERHYDFAFSVSVIEHLPAVVRRQLITEIHRRLNRGGWMILTVDVAHESDDLWNRSAGEQVEDPSRHGTFTGLLAEITESGYSILHSEIVRGWGNPLVDIGLVVAGK